MSYTKISKKMSTQYFKEMIYVVKYWFPIHFYTKSVIRFIDKVSHCRGEEAQMKELVKLVTK